MCGRFVASSPVEVIADLFSVQETLIEDTRPRYNLAPTDPVRAVVQRDGVRALEARRWGLVPHWASDGSDAASRINARAETVAELPAFRDAFARRRCIVPADGFYEWKLQPDGTKQPCYIRPTDGSMLALAGLRATNGKLAQRADTPLRTCAIITTAANRSLSAVHDRMPAILPPDVWGEWLDDSTADPAWLQSLLVPAPDDLLEVIPVGRAVNSVRNDGPGLIERVPEAVQESLPF